MKDNKPDLETNSELKTTGILVEKGVIISDQSSIDSLSIRGYGSTEDAIFTLAFYEALYLQNKDLLEVEDKKGQHVDFRSLLQVYEKTDSNAWIGYLIYRDLRSRGYVVREGFGFGANFRVYDRGAYGKNAASYMVLGIQEGKPLSVYDLTKSLHHCQSQKKALVLAVMNRRGETVYYTVSQLTFK
jgi:tRNA-intron endonuclease